MAETRLTTAGNLKVGSYVIFQNQACVVKSIQASKTGKHGSAKCRIEAVGIIDGQKRIEIYPSHDKVQVPIIDKRDAQVLSIQENIV
ncbi:MAG: translation initiation factor IF-5A, partial [Nanoarchaeota archaeon]